MIPKWSTLRHLLRRHQIDRGASAITIAITMVVLMGLAAVALDATGLGFNERRQDQSAADVGALAAVQFAKPVSAGNPECTGLTGLALSRCNGAVEARDVATATLDDPTSADWSDSSRCGSPPAGYTRVTAVSDCIAFNSNNQRAWVRIPLVDNETTFGKVIGFNTISTSAEAIAGGEFIPPGSVLPFMLPGNAASTNYNCLKAGANPKFGSCDDLPAVGNFGSADFFLYGNTYLGYTQKCTGDTNGRLVANIARGIDHPLSLHPDGTSPGIHEASNCPDWNAGPNMLNSQTGIGSNLEKGLLYGDSTYAAAPYPGAIEDPSGFKVRNGGGSTDPAWVDDTPLWDFLLDITSLELTPCDDTMVTTPLDMDACIAWATTYNAGAGMVVFDENLATSIRFGWVPQLWEMDFTGDPYHIKLARPVYLDTTFYGCTANKCTIMHTPGVPDPGGACPTSPAEPRITCGTPGNKNNGLDAVTAWIIPLNILPDNAKTPPPGSVNQRSYNLVD